MSLRIFAKETAIYGLSSILGRSLYFLLTPLYTYQLASRADYGIMTNLFAIIAMMMVAFTYRMETAYFRFSDERKEALGTAMISVVSSTIVFGVVLFAFAEPIAGLLQLDDYVMLVRLAIAILCLDALSEIPFAQLRNEGRPMRYALVRLTGVAVNIGGNLFFILVCPAILDNPNLTQWHEAIHRVYIPGKAVYYIFFSNVLSSFITLMLLSPQYARMSFRFDMHLWRRMFVYAAPLILVGFSYIINETFNRQVMPFLLKGTLAERQEQLGIYGANYKLAMLLSLFTQAFRMGAEPFFFKNKTSENAPRLYADIALYFTIAMAIGFLGVTLYLDIFKYFIGPKYREGLSVVPVLLVANVFLGLYYNLSVWYRVKDYTLWGAYIAIGGAIITIGLNVYLLPRTGYIGAAWCTLVCYVSMSLACYFIGQRFYPVPYALGKIAAYLGFSLLIYFVSRSFSPDDNHVSLRLALNTLWLLVFIAVVWYAEKQRLIQLFGKKNPA